MLLIFACLIGCDRSLDTFTVSRDSKTVLDGPVPAVAAKDTSKTLKVGSEESSAVATLSVEAG